MNLTLNESPVMVKDVFLQPGDFCWGNHSIRVKTLLGSCVSIVFWHPQMKIGGMSHIMLPEKRSGSPENNILIGKYAEDAVNLFLKEAKRAGTNVHDYQIKLFGGSNMFTTFEKKVSVEEGFATDKRINEIGYKNVLKARELLASLNLKIMSESTGGTKHRKIYLNIWNGEVWMEMKKEKS